MDGKNRGIIGMIKTVLIVIWIIFSVIMYGFICLIIGPISKKISRYFEILWASQLLGAAGIKVKVNGLEKLDHEKRYVFIANHQSHIDIPVLFTGLRSHLSFIAKKELFRIPVFGWSMFILGHIWIDRGNARKALKSIQNAVNRLKKDNISLVLFPEGTRSKDGTLGRFKQGSFALVQRAGVEVVPVAIRNTSTLLSKHSLLINSGTAQVTICDPVTISSEQNKAEISEQMHSILEKALADK